MEPPTDIRQRLDVWMDGNCSLCQRSKAWCETRDRNGRVRFIDFRTASGDELPLTHDEHQTWLLVSWLMLLDDRETALDVIENMIERESNGHSSIEALLVTDYLRGEPRFEAAVATLGIPDPPPDVAAVPW